ncbi:MAG: uroporphyrinogen decarboxylase family protein [Thermofilaceae archaeon]
MNSWERVVRAMQHETLDRIPIYEMHIPPKIAAVILGKRPDEILLHNPEAFYNLVISAGAKNVDLGKVNRKIADELLTLYSKLGLDWIRVVWAYVRVPNVERVDERTYRVDGRLVMRGGETLWEREALWDLCEAYAYDPDQVKRYCENERVEVDERVFDILRFLASKVKGKMFLSFDSDGTWGPIVSSPPLLRKVLVWAYKRPDVVEAIISYYTRIAIEYGKAAIDEGADAIQLCVDYGNKNGPWLPPALFRRFVKPALRQHVDAFKKRGAFVVLHSDGNIMPLLPDIVEAGVDAYQGIDVIAGMSLKEVKEKFGDKLCLVGNVDPRILEFGTFEDVEREVERCSAEGGKEGYILSASANISANTNAANFIHMIEYARKRGRIQ